MPFAFYSRLTRAQQAIYRRSDAITEVRLPHPADLHPLVTALGSALQSENRAATQAASERLILGLAAALGIPPVRVDVLAARPHRGWGELHGLYTAEPGQRAKIQLWMRTAKQRRVVAFRTYLRTLLHEVGHHIDYTYLRLADSYHTEGFYKRESSLFYQLVPRDEGREAASGPSPFGCDPGAGRHGDHARLSRTEQLDRLAGFPDDLARVLRGHGDATLSRRPAADRPSAKETVNHLRDVEDLCHEWLDAMLEHEDAPLTVPLPAREIVHTGDAWNALSRQRDATVERLATLPADSWRRAGLHATLGRLMLEALVLALLGHDEQHLAEVRRALPRSL